MINKENPSESKLNVSRINLPPPLSLSFHLFPKETKRSLKDFQLAVEAAMNCDVEILDMLAF